MKLAAVDIGSNAVRLLICQVLEQGSSPVFKKIELVRVPIRLGEDAFVSGVIPEAKINKLIFTMQAFKNLIKVFEAEDFRVCATAAMREAKNGQEIIKRVKQETGLMIEVVDGKTEARILYSNHTADFLDDHFAYLYIDVGGGSTELTVFSNHKILASQSFNIGTIRLLHERVEKETWDQMRQWVVAQTSGLGPLIAIGSGGNINKIYKLAYGKDERPLSLKKIKQISDYISEFSYEERISKLGLNDDRADVILPAAKIFMTVMKSAACEKIIVPMEGLSDGIVHLLYEEIISRSR